MQCHRLEYIKLLHWLELLLWAWWAYTGPYDYDVCVMEVQWISTSNSDVMIRVGSTRAFRKHISVHFVDVYCNMLMQHTADCRSNWDVILCWVRRPGHPVDSTLLGGMVGDLLLTHWGRDRMATIFQTTISNTFSWISIKISLKSVTKCPINNIPTLFQIMAGPQPGDKPLSEAMVVSFLTHICVIRPQWVNMYLSSSFHFWSVVPMLRTVSLGTLIQILLFVISSICNCFHGHFVPIQ